MGSDFARVWEKNTPPGQNHSGRMFLPPVFFFSHAPASGFRGDGANAVGPTGSGFIVRVRRGKRQAILEPVAALVAPEGQGFSGSKIRATGEVEAGSSEADRLSHLGGVQGMPQVREFPPLPGTRSGHVPIRPSTILRNKVRGRFFGCGCPFHFWFGTPVRGKKLFKSNSKPGGGTNKKTWAIWGPFYFLWDFSPEKTKIALLSKPRRFPREVHQTGEVDRPNPSLPAPDASGQHSVCRHRGPYTGDVTLRRGRVARWAPSEAACCQMFTVDKARRFPVGKGGDFGNLIARLRGFG